MNIAQDTRFTLCEKNNVYYENGKPFRLTGKDIKTTAMTNAFIDKRLFLCSINNEQTITEYLAYLKIFCDAVKTHILSVEQPFNKQILSILKMGFIPVWTPPTFMSAIEMPDLVNALERSGDKVISVEPYRMDGSIVSGAPKDKYVSRTDAMKRLKVERPQDVKLSEYIIEVLKC